MHLDIRTLFIAYFLVSLTLTALLVAFWRGHRNIPGLAEWALSSVLIALGLVSILLPDILTANFSRVLADTLGVLGMAALWNGARLFRGRHARWGDVLVVTLAVAALNVYCTYVVDDVSVQVTVAWAVSSLACGLCAWELAYKPRRPLRGTAFLAVVAFATLAAACAARVVAMLWWPPTPDIFAPNAAVGVDLLVRMIGQITVTVVVLMMAAEHLRGRIEKQNADLESARIAAEEASRAKSEFLATMSHELRTPLNAIIGFSDILCHGLFGPLGDSRYREYVKDIHTAGTHLLDVITTILDISKAEAGKLEVDMVDLDPARTLDATLPLIRNLADEKRIRIVVEAPRKPLVCRADPQALKQILLNLLSNAVKFTSEGGTITVRLHRAAADAVEIAVSDTGVGIAPQDLPRLMKPFEQVAQGYTRRHRGTGLGLPLVDSLVRLHGGTLRIESTVDVGTTVAVRLLAPPSASVAASAA